LRGLAAHTEIPVSQFEADCVISHFDELPDAIDRLMSAGLVQANKRG
jgi:hypothetical protein